MDSKISLKVITQKDLFDSGCFNIPEVIKVVESTLENYSIENVIFPNKVSVIFNENKQSRINFLPAAIKSEGIYAGKWVSVFPGNPHEFQRPNLSAVNIISELNTGFPIAFMEGSLESNLRTAAMGSVAAKYLSRDDSNTIGFIGAGEQAKAHFMTMKSVRPNISRCKVASRTTQSEEKFITQLKRLYPMVDFVACRSNYEEATIDADIIVTAISGQEKILKAEWISEGAFYCHVAGLEDEFGVAQKADKIVVDSWNVVKHRTQTISQMYKAGLLQDNDIYADLYEIVQKKKPARVNRNEFIYFNSVGLSFIDTAVSYYMYKKVLEAGLGKTVTICSDSMFNCDPQKITL